MSKCRRYRALLAVYRELGARDKARVDAHVAACESCTALLRAYEQQDRALAALPRLTPTARFVAPSVLIRLQPRPIYRVYALAVALALLLAGLGVTARVSASALPGEPLYEVKRVVEAARYTLTVREQSRQALDETLAERRRLEAREVQRLGRTAALVFEGEVEAVQGDWWTISGVSIAVPADLVEAGVVPLGAYVHVHAQAIAGRITATQLQFLAAAPGPPGTPTWTPTIETPGTASDNEEAGHDAPLSGTTPCTVTPQHGPTRMSPTPALTPTAGAQPSPTGHASPKATATPTGRARNLERTPTPHRTLQATPTPTEEVAAPTSLPAPTSQGPSNQSGGSKESSQGSGSGGSGSNGGGTRH